MIYSGLNIDLVIILTRYVLIILASFSASFESDNRLCNTYVYLYPLFGSDGDLKTDFVVETQNDFLTITNLISPDIVKAKNVKLEWVDKICKKLLADPK